MVDASHNLSSENDPLHAYSGLSLFPRTLKSLSNPLPPLLYQSKDLQQTHTLLESMPFEVQNEHQEQAKAILADTNVDVKLNPIPNKRERRPGLDRKRKAFSLNLTTSQVPPVAPSFDGSKFPRPEDYFAEYDKFELANREWQKLTGSSVIDTQQNPPSRCPRRQGIPGRKRVPYKHTYTDSYFTDAINLEPSVKENPIPSEKSLDKTTAAHDTTADKEVDDSTEHNKDLSNILSELLACSQDELKGGAAIKLLEDRLLVKPFNVERLNISEFQGVRKMDLEASGRNPSSQKSVLSDIQNMLKGSHRDAIRKNSHSPFPLTKKQSSPNPPEDQFSFPDIHNLLPGDLQSSEVDLQPLAKDIANTSSSIVSTVDVASPYNNAVEKSSGEDDSDTHSGRFHSSPDGKADNCVNESISNQNTAMIEVNIDMPTKGTELDVPMNESEANRNTGKRENVADINEETDHSERLAQYVFKEVTRPITVEEDSIPYQQGASSKSPNRAPEQYNTMDVSFDHAEHIQGLQGEEKDNADSACGLQEQNTPEVHNSSHKQSRKQRTRESSDNGETGGDKQMKTLPHESGAKKQSKAKSNKREVKKPKKTVTRESKIFSRRKSLAAAGTKMEAGVRRSTRIKSRPLEYWRGERFLYGRIHESLTTVIGIKYGSPGVGKSDLRAKKVKSFVSDEYKELIDFAALH